MEGCRATLRLQRSTPRLPRLMRNSSKIIGRLSHVWNRRPRTVRIPTCRAVTVWVVLAAYLSSSIAGPYTAECSQAVSESEAVSVAAPNAENVQVAKPESEAKSAKGCCQSGTGGCKCSVAQRTSGNCCCAGKLKAAPARSCCASKVAKADTAKCESVVKDSPPAEDVYPVWTACTCGHAPVTAFVVTADPRMVNDKPSLPPEPALEQVAIQCVVVPESVSTAPETPPPEFVAV